MIINPFMFAVAGGGPALVAHTGAATPGSPWQFITTSAIDTTGATFLVLSLAFYAPTVTVTISDSKSNTWTALTRRGAGTDVDILTYVCYSPTVGSGHTFSLDSSPNGSFATMEVMAFSGITASAVNTSTGASTSSSSTGQPGSITPSVANTLVITAVAFDDNASGAVSINGGYTISDTVPYGTANNFGGSAAYIVLTSASAQNPTWNVTNSAVQVTAAIAAFAY